MAVAYKSAGAGAMTETNGATLNLPCPATVDANDILIAHVVVWGTTYSPTTPSGWTLLFGPYGLGTGTPTARAWAYGKIAAGNEDGANVNFGTIAATTGRMGRIYSFSGYVSGAIGDVVPSASYAGNSSETDPVIQSVTTTVEGAKAIALISQDDNNYHSSLGDVTGGTWAEAVSDYVSSSVGPAGGCLQLQVGTPTSDPGTIAGGTVAGNDDEANTICFEIRPNLPNTPPTVALDSPEDEATTYDTTPDLEFTGTDPEDDDVTYEVQVATDDQFTEEGTVTKSDYYTDGTNSRTVGYTGSNIGTGVGQSFIAIDGFIDSCKFGLSEGAGSPTGNAYAKIYEYSGTWGTDAIPTGDPVAVSDAFDVTTISGASQTLYTFSFTGENRAFLTGGKGYIVAFEYGDGDSSNYLHIYVKGYSLTDPGNASWKDTKNNWRPYDYNDLNYEVYQTQNSAVVVDSYSESNQDNINYLNNNYTGQAQSFTPSSTETIISCKWYLKKAGSPTGNAVAKIYGVSAGHSPTGSALATSDNFDVSTLTTTLQLITFTFSGDEQIELSSGTEYAVAVEYAGGDGTNYVNCGIDNSSPTHSGIHSTLEVSTGNYRNLASYDNIFYVYAKEKVSLLIDAVSDADAGFSGDPDNTDPFASAQAVTYTVQSALEPDTYYWRVRGKDPDGTNTFGDWSSPVRSFTISGTAASSDRLLYTKGKAVASSDRLLYTRGKLTNFSDRSLYSNGGLAGSSDRLLYSKGISTGSTDRGLYTKGKTTASSEKSVYTKGRTTGNSTRGLYTKGISTSSSLRGIYSKGGVNVSSDRPLYSKGKSVGSSDKLLYTKGSLTGSDTRLIYSKGVATNNSNRQIFTKGIATDNSSRSLYTKGISTSFSQKDIYSKGVATTGSERGVYSKGSIPTSSERLLHTKGINTDTSQRGIFSIGSIKGWSQRGLHTIGSIAGSSSRNIYLSGIDTKDSERSIYTRGQLASSSERSLYTWGSDQDSSERGLYVRGGIIASSERAIYTLGISGDSSERSLYTRGGSSDASERAIYVTGCIPADSVRGLYTKGTWKPWVDKSVEYGTIYKDKGVVSGSSFNKTIINKTDTFSKRDTSEGSVWIDEKASVINNFTRKL